MNNLKFNPLTKVGEFRLKLYPKDFYTVRDFYQKVLKWPIIDSWDQGKNEKGAMFATGGATLELLSPKAGFEPIQGATISIEVHDVMKLWDYIKNKAPVVFKPRHNSWGDKSFCVTDPEGFKITFFTKD